MTKTLDEDEKDGEKALVVAEDEDDKRVAPVEDEDDAADDEADEARPNSAIKTSKDEEDADGEGAGY